MGKNKPRHNPDKPQNKYGSVCMFYETRADGSHWCHNNNIHYSGRVDICEGNRHNCIRNVLHREASKSDKQKNGDWD